MITLRIFLSLALITSFYTLPTPSKIYSHYSYHCIKNSCLALIQEHRDAAEAVRYIMRLNSDVAFKVLTELIKDGKIPKKYGYEINN